MTSKMKIALMIFAGIAVTAIFSLNLNIQAEDATSDTSHEDYFDEPFATPQDVTKACMECHADAAEDFMKTRHWNWLGDEFEKDGKTVRVGKQNLINNFCIAVPSNEPRCTSCHPGYGWKDNTFDFTKAENIDCLVCHEQTGKYKKVPTGAGMPAEGVDLLASAKSVGKPTVQNCGQCHFNGGGGEGVKHGDLDPTLLTADKSVDVHIGGNGMQCIDCHTSQNHKIMGASHGSMAAGTNHISCTNCHDYEKEPIHKNAILERHLDDLACETCHIPEIGRNMATKTHWDWSTAGQREDETDAEGRVVYSKKKGDFEWKMAVEPEYLWYDGSADYYSAGDVIDPSGTVYLNTMNGDISDMKSKIAPFKKMTGEQPYDPKFNYIIIPKLFGPGGFWKTFDWAQASEAGMKEAGLEFSGEVGFVKTAMYWPQNHAVTVAKEALGCTDCHGKGKKLDFEALGYPGDPMRKGGREKNGLVK